MSIKKYPDVTSYAVIEDNDYNITHRVNTYEDLWHLNQITDAFYSHTGIKPIVTIPWLIDGQADKRFKGNQSFGLKLVLRLLRDMPVEKFKIFHPHNSYSVEMALDNVEIISNADFIKEVLTRIPTDNLALMFPDSGAFKWGQDLVKEIGWTGNYYSAHKAHVKGDDGTNGLIQRVDEEDFQRQDILLIDDCSIYGGTFKGLAKIIGSRNCGQLFAAFSTITVREIDRLPSGASIEPVTNYYDKVFTTNSKYDSYKSWQGSEMGTQPENLEVIKIF